MVRANKSIFRYKIIRNSAGIKLMPEGRFNLLKNDKHRNDKICQYTHLAIIYIK